MKRICVFCGSSIGSEPQYLDMAIKLGKCLVKNDLELVYGGGNVGLMGKISETVIKNNGKVTGVIPESIYNMLDTTDHIKLSKLYKVNTMHERKAKMNEISDGFIALPGGIGTLEELFEMFTWNQLGFHSKPVAILNVSGFYDKMLDFLQNIVKNKFMKQEHLDVLIVDNDPDDLIEKMKKFRAIKIDKWWK